MKKTLEELPKQQEIYANHSIDSLHLPKPKSYPGTPESWELEPAAGWNYEPEHPDVTATAKYIDAAMKRREVEEAIRRREIAYKSATKELDDLARKDAAKDIAKSVVAQMKREATEQGQYNSPIKSYHPVDGTSINEVIKQQAALDDAIINKLNQLEQKLSGLDANLNKLQTPAPTNEVPNSGHSRTSIARDLFAEADLRELERMLDDLERASVRASVPTEQDIKQFIKTLEDAGAKVVAVNGKPVTATASSDLNTYLEREAAMASVKNRNGWFNEPDGTQKHYVNGVLHMAGDNPAEVRPNGTSLYYKNGNLHRDGNLPAMLGVKGTAKFAVNGKYHRLGGLPAVTWSKGPYRNEWWVNGEIERAVRKDGTEEWYAPGCDDRDEAVLSRTDGPAVIHPPDVRGNRREEFWINGNQFTTREQWINALSRLNDIQEEALDHELIDEDPIDAIDETPVTINEAKPTKTKKEKTMTKPSFTETLKANAVSAGYRVAGTQLTTVVKSAILTVMRDKGADGGAIQAFSAFLDTEFGAAMISFMIGSGLPYVPHFGDDPRVARLATELQVGGMATAGNAIIGEAMQHVLPAVSQILNSLPAADGETTSNVRVIESKDSKLAESLMEEGEEETDTEETSAKTMKA